MSRDERITADTPLKERFEIAREDLEFWQQQYEQWGKVDDLIAAAQKWGILCGLAAAYPELKEELSTIKPRLYPSEYAEAEPVPF